MTKLGFFFSKDTRILGYLCRFVYSLESLCRRSFENLIRKFIALMPSNKNGTRPDSVDEAGHSHSQHLQWEMTTILLQLGGPFIERLSFIVQRSTGTPGPGMEAVRSILLRKINSYNNANSWRWRWQLILPNLPDLTLS